MKSSTQEVIVIVSCIITSLSSQCGAVLTGYETPYDQDITTHREFGCQWYGGSSSTLTCSCSVGAEMVIEGNSIPSYSTTNIEISRCKSVTFRKNAIGEMRSLRNVKLSDLESITFDEESMTWYGYRDIRDQYEERFDLSVPSLKITIRNSNITLISSHAFRGRINEITFDGVVVDKVLPVAFANLLQNEKIAIKNSMFKSLDLQIFKKFTTENLELDGVMADIVPSRTFSNVTVNQKVLINNCTFNVIRSGAFSINDPRVFEVTNNNVKHLSGEGFKIISRGTVLFRNNTFNEVDDGAFLGITTSKDVFVDTMFTFDSNTFSSITRNSLSVSDDFNPKFKNIYIDEPCDCKSIDHNIKETIYYPDIMCLHDNAYMVVEEYKSNMCSVITNYYITIIIVCVVIVLVAAVISALVLYYKFVYRSKKYGSEKQNKKGNISLIVPDGRTYRETELHVIVEKTDLLTTDL